MSNKDSYHVKKGKRGWESDKELRIYRSKQSIKVETKQQIKEGVAEMEKLNINIHLGNDGTQG